MTVSSTLEAKLRRREASLVPAEAACRVLGVEATGIENERRFATIVHWSYGTGWGAARGGIAEAGLAGGAAALAHFAAVWLSALAMLPALGGTPPPWRWGAAEIATDAFHHAIYAAATSFAYARL